jgi:hypothetical protein
MDKLIPLIEKVLGTLADKLGVGLDVLWAALNKQAALAAAYHRWFAFLWAALVGVCVLVGAIAVIKAVKSEYDTDGLLWTGIFVWGMGAFLITGIFVEWYAYLTAKNNAAYWAIDKILSAIGSGQ